MAVEFISYCENRHLSFSFFFFQAGFFGPRQFWVNLPSMFVKVRFLKPWVISPFLNFCAWGFSFADGLDLFVRGGNFYYEEPDAEISYSGIVSGIRGAYEKSLSRCVFQLRSEIMSGNLTYDGSLNTQLAEGACPGDFSGQTLSVKPFLDVWMVDESDTDDLEFEGSRVLVKFADGTYGDYREPANITLAGGLELALYF
jgi:hypothetical protein